MMTSWEMSKRYTEPFSIIPAMPGIEFSTRFIHSVQKTPVEEFFAVNEGRKYYAILKEKGKIIGSVSHDLHHMITSAYFTAAFETIVHDK